MYPPLPSLLCWLDPKLRAGILKGGGGSSGNFLQKKRGGGGGSNHLLGQFVLKSSPKGGGSSPGEVTRARQVPQSGQLVGS